MRSARTLTLALAGLWFLGAIAGAMALGSQAYDAASFKAAQDAGTPILVHVYAPWCPTCKAQEQVLDQLAKRPEYAGVTLFRVDYDTQQDAVASFGARSQSTLIAYKGASETGRSAGNTDAKSIEDLLKSTLK